MTTFVLICQISLIIEAKETNQWQEWSSWSNCSSSCGHGIATRSRQCNRQKQSDRHVVCPGQISQHKVCLSQVCSSEHQSSRHLACSQYDGKIFSGRKYSWEPFINPTHPCKLSCRAKGVVFYANFPGRAEDGTPCNTGSSRAVCFQGACQPVGCDDLIDSRAVRDKCGVCKGNNSTCKTISGIYTSSELRRGLNYVLSIPEGSTNINITELQPSRNVIYLETSTGQTVINDDNAGPAVKDVVAAAGTFFKHLAKSPTNFKESVVSTGPTNQTLVLKLNVKDINPGVFYTFNVPNMLTDTVLRQISHQVQPEEIPSVIRHRPQPVELSAESEEDDVTSSTKDNKFSDLGRRLHLQLGPLSEDNNDDAEAENDTRTDVSAGTGSAVNDTGHSAVTDTVTTTTQSVKENDVTYGAGLQVQDTDSKPNNEPEMNDDWSNEEPLDSSKVITASGHVSVTTTTNGLLNKTNVSSQLNLRFSDLDQTVNVSVNVSQNATTSSPEVSTINSEINTSTEQKITLTTNATTLEISAEGVSGYNEGRKQTSHDLVTKETTQIQESETYSEKVRAFEPFGKDINSLSPNRAPNDTTVGPKIIISAKSGGKGDDIPKFSQSFTYNGASLQRRQSKRRHDGSTSREIHDTRRGPGNGHDTQQHTYERQQRGRLQTDRQRQLQERQKLLEQRRLRMQEQENQYYQRLQEYNDRLKQRREEIERRRTSHASRNSFSERRHKASEHGNRKVQDRAHETNNLRETRVDPYRPNNVNPQTKHVDGRTWIDHRGNAIDSLSSSREVNRRGHVDHRINNINSRNTTSAVLNKKETHDSVLNSGRQNGGKQSHSLDLTADNSSSDQLAPEQEELIEGNVVRIKERPKPVGTRHPATTPNSAFSGVEISVGRSGEVASSNHIPADYIPSSNEQIPRDIVPNQIYLGSEPSSRSVAYEWRISGLTDCSHTCGGGAQNTVIVCVDILSQAVVTDDNCRHVIKPDVVTLSCNKRPCPAVWTPGVWTQCSVTCGQGEQVRVVTCQARVSPTLNLTMPKESCEHLTKPVTDRVCSIQPCSSWRVSNWTKCSAGCGDGQRSRDVQCADVNSTVLSDDMCSDLKPVSEERCNLEECGKGWFFSEWLDECPTSCGTGEITRHVYCGDEGGNPVSDERCDVQLRPATNKSCRANRPCGGSWFTGPWSNCDAVCGTGHKRREVLCIKTFNGGVAAVVGEENCDNTTRPDHVGACQGPTCVSRWYVTSWNQCSQSCGTGHRTREVKCLSGEHKPSDDCSLQARPKVREHCNTQECLNGTANQQSPLSQDPMCEDKSDQCVVVKRARLCQYGYYKTECCRSCADD
ncbi:Thrombospondin type-1 domain-containing protein 4 [Bulinus truncatus]|nr:Thrombospondin type-1 domain-containing protein 4 [Bulinus truncatus]